MILAVFFRVFHSEIQFTRCDIRIESQDLSREKPYALSFSRGRTRFLADLGRIFHQHFGCQHRHTVDRAEGEVFVRSVGMKKIENPVETTIDTEATVCIT
ncbi:MAG: hypothetical protein AMJ75_03320 [Phycisphaerae bacterium SM1_79]|nr:MAG: hypothetical protein AMJ75_03320 [Phycisphaerae bacterium SM1_79]